MLIGSFFVRPVPLPISESPESDHAHISPTEPRSQRVNSSTRLLNNDNDSEDEDDEMAPYHAAEPTTPAEHYIPEAVTSVEMGLPGSPSRHRSSSQRTRSRGSLRSHGLLSAVPDISGKRLFCTINFWVAFLVLTIREKFPFALDTGELMDV